MWNEHTLDEREIPPMSAEMFSALVSARLRLVQGVEVQGGKGLQLKLRVHGQDTTAQLERLYKRYRANPDGLSPVVDQFIESLIQGEREENAGNEAFARVREKLFPRLMTSEQWMNKRDEGLRLVIRSIVQDLGTALVLDHGDSFEYVQLDAIPTWGIDATTAYEVALDNLERASSDAETAVHGEGIEKLLIDASNNAAARALLPSRVAAWQAQIEGGLVMALPTHDLMLGFSRQHPALGDLRAQIAKDAQQSPKGLLPAPVAVREGAFELLP